MKNIIHILYFLSFLIIANPVVGEPTMVRILSMLLRSDYLRQHYKLGLEMFSGTEGIIKRD